METKITSEFILLIVLFIVCLFVVIGWIIVASQETEEPSQPPMTEAQYGTVCSSSRPCAEGLVCEQINDDVSVCKTQMNYPCTTILQCESSALYCANVCSLTNSGGIGQPGPCNEGLVEDEFQICRYDTGEVCSENIDCATQSCVNGICSITYANGDVCTSNDYCISKNCSNGICQEYGVVTGEEGAICSLSNSCNDPYTCYINFESDFTDFGVCRVTSTFPGVCSESVACPFPTICWQGECVFPRTESEYTPDSCSFTGECIDSMTCHNGQCQNNQTSGLFRWKDNDWKFVRNLVFLQDYVVGSVSILERPEGPLVIYKSSEDEYITNANGERVLAPYWRIWDISNDGFNYLYVTGNIRRGDYKNNGTVESSTDINFYLQCDNFKFTPGNSIMFTYMLNGSPSPNAPNQTVYRVYIADINDPNIFANDTITFEIWLSTVRVNSVDYRITRGIMIDNLYITGITSVNIEDRPSSSGQIKFSLSDVDNFLGGNVYAINQLNMDQAGAGAINLILFRNNCNYAAPFVWDWMQYFPDEYIFNQIQDRRGYISYDNMYDPLDPTVYSEEILNVTLPPMNSLTYVDLGKIAMYYPYGDTINYLVLAYVVQYQNRRLIWAIINGYSVYLPSANFKDIGVSMPVTENHDSYIYQIR